MSKTVELMTLSGLWKP